MHAPLAWVCSVLITLPSAAVASAAASTSLAGVDTFGSVSEDIWIGMCSTCDHEVSDLGVRSDGGAGAQSAHVAFSGGRGGLAGFEALASFGADALPLLGVQANVMHFDTGVPDLRSYDYAANALARGVQQFTYVGGTAADYTFSFQMTGGISVLPIFANAVSAYGFAGLYDGIANIEKPYGDVLGADAVDAATVYGDVPFSVPLVVSATLNPGQSFYLVAVFSATIANRFGNTASVEGLHTMSGAITQGSPGLLLASAVPEPASAAIWLAGLAGVAAAARLKAWRRSG